MIDEIDQAIRAINPNAKYTMRDGIENIEWHEDTTPINVSDINSKIDELKYKRDRQAEYPSIVDQLDDIYHNGIDGWKATIKTTKDKYPKGNE